MNLVTPHDEGRRSLRLSVTLAVLAATALIAAGCGSSDTEPTAAEEAGVSAGVEHARKQVERYAGTVSEFKPPGPPLKNVESLRGKTVFYIPITLQAPAFAIAAKALEAALGEIGVNVTACSADGTPKGAAECLQRALAAGAGGVVADAVPIGLAANAFEQLRQREIPILVTNQLPPPRGAPGAVEGLGDHRLGYQPNDGMTMLRLIADWVIADSNGDANVLIVKYTNSPSSEAYVDEGAVPEFEQHCPSCEIEIVEVTTANTALIPSQTSSALLRNPDIDYVLVEFDAALQAVFEGVQKAGALNRVKGASTTAVLGALQMLAGGRFLAADAGWSFPYQGWANADAIIRQMLGEPPVEGNVPIRLLTNGNIDSVTLTPDAEASGGWYGGSGYKEMFLELWGVGG